MYRSRPFGANFVILAIALALLPAATTTLDESTYVITENDNTRTVYSKLRKALVSDNWNPAGQSDPAGCDSYAAWCSTRPEMNSCATFAPIPRCSWTWVRRGKSLTVITLVDGDEVESVQTEAER
jgi:hypothetical protein